MFMREPLAVFPGDVNPITYVAAILYSHDGTDFGCIVITLDLRLVFRSVLLC